MVAAMAEPTSVLLLQNDKGKLTAEPFLTEKLTPSAANWQRRFYNNRIEVIDAVMHARVLVPEGRSDHMLLKTVLRALMLCQEWGNEHANAFGLEVGLVPTEDAKVLQTFSDLQRIHPRVCCLVDGDNDGRRYIRELAALANPPSSIISWANGKTIEDVIGWVLEADPDYIEARIKELPELDNIDIPGVVALLKLKKCDQILYETVAEALSGSEACRARAHELYQGLVKACSGSATARFTRVEQVWVFQP